jgi:PAS domain S-box-containing protein
LSARAITLSPITRYGVAVACAGAAIVARQALDPLWGLKLPYITLFPAIMVSAWLGGTRPGIVTTLITGVAAEYLWVEPSYSWRVVNVSELLGIGMFLLVGVVISALNGAWRRGTVALSESEQRLTVTLTSIGDAVITTDQEGRITRMNAIAERLTGRSAAEAIGVPLRDTFVIVNEFSHQPTPNPVDRVLREGVIAGLANDTVLVSKDGNEIPIDDSAAPIRTASGEMIGVVMVFRDISERRRAERAQTEALERERLAREDTDRARREAETAAQQLRTALDAGRMGTWQYTMATGHVRWSSGLEAIHGYAPGTFPGTFDAFRDEIHPDDRDRVLTAIAEAAEQRRDHHVEYRIIRRDGTVRWVEGRGQLFLDNAQQPERMMGVCADVTERRQADERFRLAVDAAPAAMIMVDQRGVIVLANALAERLLGYSANEIVGEPVERLVPPRFRQGHPEFRRAFFAEPNQRPMGAGRDLYALRRDGSEVPVEIGISPITTHEGAFVLAAVTDITVRKEIEEQRTRLLAREQAARTELERASRLKDEFLAVLSHELRTPLNAVLGYAHVLNSGVLPPERTQHALDAIQRNAHAQARLVESLLDLSRVMAGKLELDLHPLEVSRLVDAAIDVVRPDAEAKRIVLDVVAPTDPVRLMGDGGRLQQVLWNLLANAIKFTPADGRIIVGWRRQSAQVHIHVTDTGHGISAEFLPHVFERFSQAEGDKRRSRPGLGLGLALVREMVHAHGGTVAANSPGAGKGSTFTITLPVSRAADVPSRDTTPAAVAVSLPGLEILVVDDDGDVRDLLAFVLESRGAIVRTASSAGEALHAIDERRPHVLLADVRMPDEDGYSLIRRVRAAEQTRHDRRLPAIAVTAYASPSDRDQALRAGYDSHVVKPVDPEALARTISHIAGIERA